MNTGGATIARNTAILALTDVAARCLTLVLVVVVARRLGPARMGMYAFCVAMTGFLQILANFGMDPLIMRLAARSHGNEGSLLMRITYVKTAVYICGAALFNAGAFFFAPAADARALLALFSLSAFFTINLGSVNCFFRARQKAVFEAASAIVVRLVNTAAGSLAVLAGAGLTALACIELASALCGCAAGWTFFARFIDRPRFAAGLRECAGLLRNSWRFFLTQISQTITHSVNPVMLPLLASATAAGHYSAAARLIGAFLLIPAATTNTMLPYLSKLSVDGKERYARAYAAYARILGLIGGGIFCCIAIVARELLVLIYGKAFIAGQTALLWGAATIWLIYLNGPLSMVMFSRDREAVTMMIMGLSAAMHAALSLLLIPRWQAAGAAAASAGAQAAVLALSYGLLSPALRRELRPISAIAPTLASTGAACSVGWLLARHIDAAIALPVAATVFAVVSMLLGAIRISDFTRLAHLRPGVAAEARP